MKKYVFVSSVAGIILLLDQLSKWYIRQTLSLYESIVVIDSLFHITHVRNSGGAFGLFAGGHEAWRLPFFLFASLIAVVVLLVFVRRTDPQHRLLLFALGTVLGGALGNLIDRMLLGQVTDFLDVHWRGYHWPTFNIADSGITTGVLILLFYSLVVRDGTAADTEEARATAARSRRGST